MLLHRQDEMQGSRCLFFHVSFHQKNDKLNVIIFVQISFFNVSGSCYLFNQSVKSNFIFSRYIKNPYNQFVLT